MKEYIPVLKRTQLFRGMNEEEIAAIMKCFGMWSRKYKKGEVVCHSGEPVRSMGILVAGKLMVQKDDYWGNRNIVNDIAVGEIFGACFAAQDGEESLNDVIAAEDSVTLGFEMKRLFTTCSNACRFHMRMIENLMRSMFARNRMLAQKIDYISKRSTRGKLIAYLSAQAEQAGSSSFDIPFNRQQLADFLGVDRSAMSKELSRMRDDGMIAFERNHFTLI